MQAAIQNTEFILQSLPKNNTSANIVKPLDFNERPVEKQISAKSSSFEEMLEKSRQPLSVENPEQSEESTEVVAAKNANEVDEDTSKVEVKSDNAKKSETDDDFDSKNVVTKEKNDIKDKKINQNFADKDFIEPDIELSYQKLESLAKKTEEKEVLPEKKSYSKKLEDDKSLKFFETDVLPDDTFASLDFQQEFYFDNDKIFLEDDEFETEPTKSRTAKKFALDGEGKISVIDFRNENRIKEIKDSLQEEKVPELKSEIRYDGKNSAEITMSVEDNAMQNITSSNSQTASSLGSTYQAMLTNQLQQNASDFVKAGSIILKDNNVGQIKLILHPEDLGNVKIDLHISDKVISGRITVSSEEAMGAFKDSMANLRQAFAESGYETAAFELSMAGGNAADKNFSDQKGEEAANRIAMKKAYSSFVADAGEEYFEENINSFSLKKAINIVA